MTIYSMTGYATAQAEVTSANGLSSTLGVELRSVNSRFLDLTFKMPEDFRASEPLLREKLTQGLRRGKVELRVWVEHTQQTGLRIPDPLMLNHLRLAQDAIQAQLPSAAPLSVSQILGMGHERHSDLTAAQQEALPGLLQQAIAALQKARATEGKRLQAVLLQCLQGLGQLANQAEPLVPAAVEQQRSRFIEKFQSALYGSNASLDSQSAQERALTEATAYAIRIDVAEELARLRSHLEEIESLLKKGGELGKRLDFLIQELHREANTLGSKASTLELTRVSVDMKVLVEQMREQVQNIE